MLARTWAPLAISVLLFSQSALAASISFGLSLAGSKLTLVNQGSESAFYPAIFRMLPDGRWTRLGTNITPAELPPGARLVSRWSEPDTPSQQHGIDGLQPVMVRFFDRAGVGLGQVSFLRPPPVATRKLEAGYVDGTLQIEPPDSTSPIRTSWVLWPQEEGTRPIRLPVSFQHHPPSALRIDWSHHGPMATRIDTGAGLPATILVHETERGYTQQVVRAGRRQGTEQRAAWLDAAPLFYSASVVALVCATGVLLVQSLRGPRSRPREP